ncbi:MAG: hypothetical protein GY801_39170 [bacterium]|nr:hypothetical protein [bacterium]
MAKHRNIYWVSLAWVLLSLISCSEEQESFYQDKPAVIEDQAIERGWIPNILPDSASNIYETHELDMNTGVGEFVFHDRDERWFQERLNVRLSAKIRQHVITQYRLPDTHEVFISGDFIVAVDWEKNDVIFVRPYQTAIPKLIAQIEENQATEDH